MTNAYIRAIEYYLPEGIEYNDPQDYMTKKIGIYSKHIAAVDEYASDMACRASEKLFESGIDRTEIDYLLYCTQSPDYYLPTTACLIQERLGLTTRCGALDFNLGCSGFVYGLSMAKGLVVSGQVNNVLLITSETYSKFVNRRDRSVNLLFGDAAAAALISKTETGESYIGSFIFGTDGRGGEKLIVQAGGLRNPASVETSVEIEDERGNFRSQNNLFMSGKEVYKFALREVPKAIDELLHKENRTLADYDYFVFHQANLFMMDSLRQRLDIPEGKFSVQMEDCGNTVSASIPIALKRDYLCGNIKKGDRIMLVGFGVGYSWSACSIVWNG
ncbi:MAG TPA: ketoacyl-ACP synthase III [Desulfobacteria bacterium]|nr:ketoacyl-ACP synthase III [Desulfobacteria bacterium]